MCLASNLRKKRALVAMSLAEFVSEESGLQNNFLRHEHHAVKMLRPGHEWMGVRNF